MIDTKNMRSRSAVGFLVVLIVLMSSGAGAADIPNPSFETTYDGLPWPRLLPMSWWHTDHPSFNSYCTSQWSTDGGLSAALLTRIGKPVSPGDCQSFYQYVDFTGISSIQFDVCLVAYPAAPFEHFEASVLIDYVPVWTQDTEGVYLNQEVSVLGLSDWHCIEIRLTAVDTGSFDVAYWTEWDNLRLVEGPKTIPAAITLNPATVTPLDPATLNPRSNGNWITCYIELDPAYDPNQIDGSTVKLNDVPAVMGKQGWATPEGTAANVMDYDSDGIFERMVKFDRAAVQALVKAPEATVTITGRLAGGTPFEGTAVIKVLDKDGKKK